MRRAAARGVLGAVVTVTLLGALALRSGAEESPPGPVPDTASASEPSTTTTSTTTAGPPAGAVDVVPTPGAASSGDEIESLGATTRRTYTFVDTSRATPCIDAPDRTLPVTVFYPSTGSSFPVVLVGPGSGASQRAVARDDAEAFAARGYLAVALSFPCTNLPGLSTTDPQVALDIYSQPGDVSFVLSSLLAKSSTIADRLFGLLDPARVGYTGTSSGAVTGLLLFNTCCADPRIDAIVAAKGFPLPTGAGLPVPGTYDWALPVALYQWGACFDDVTPYEPAYAAFRAANPPKLFMQDATGNHSTPVTFPPGTYEAFFDRYVALDPSPVLVETLVGAGSDPHYAYDLAVPGIDPRVTLPACVNFTG